MTSGTKTETCCMEFYRTHPDAPFKNTERALNSFLDKIFFEPNTGCWLWDSTMINTGYGRMMTENRNLLAHRVSHMLFMGPIPKGCVVMHLCDQPACVNPRHLVAGSRRQNIGDAIAKGRFGDSISNETIAEILDARSDLAEKLADQMGLSKRTIMRVIREERTVWPTASAIRAELRSA